MGGQLFCGRPNDPADIFKKARQLFMRQMVCKRMIALGHNILPGEHLEPANFNKQLFILAEDAARFAEQVHFVLQRGWNVHFATALPEWGISALVGVIMKDDKIPNALIIKAHPSVERGNVYRVKASIGEVRDELRNAILDQVVEAGRGSARSIFSDVVMSANQAQRASQSKVTQIHNIRS